MIVCGTPVVKKSEFLTTGQTFEEEVGCDDYLRDSIIVCATLGGTAS